MVSTGMRDTTIPVRTTLTRNATDAIMTAFLASRNMLLIFLKQSIAGFLGKSTNTRLDLLVTITNFSCD